MVDPVLIPRAEHPISRRQIDPDALKVLYRLHQHHHKAYLVGGSVRDLLLGRQPKDFDLGTSAHPYEVKRLFRQCWIIGRRFRLAHVKFGPKTIEVATFRRKVPIGEDPPVASPHAAETDGTTTISTGVRVVHHDNTFGTPEEDAFRRDFTLNALFYDIATFGIIDYTGGLADLRAGLIRCIGDPDERFIEDPVRMLRAVALEARLDFRIDPPVLEAIERRRLDLVRSSPPRLVEEFYKILRAGVSTRAFRGLREMGLLESVAPELQFRSSDGLWQSLAELDTVQTTYVLSRNLDQPHPARFAPRPPGVPGTLAGRGSVGLGTLPLARRDVEQLRHILQMQRRLVADVDAPTRVRRGLIHRSSFSDALTWLAIHGHAPAVVDSWRAFVTESASHHGAVARETEEGGAPRRRRRRRRRHGGVHRRTVE